MYHCALENIKQFLVARKTESVIATDHELSVGVSSKDPVRNRQNFFVHIALSHSKRWRGCLALLDVNYSDWWLLQPGCTTWTGVDWCRHLYMSTHIFTLFSVELAASARGHQCQQWCDGVSASAVWYVPLNWVHFAVAGGELRWHLAGGCCSNQSGWWWRRVPWS